MDNICPYCGNELLKGFIDGGKYCFKWHDENMSFLEKHTIFGGEILSDNNIVICYRCKICNRIIINLDELRK